MKFKYPKKITIGSTEFKIIYDYKSDFGACFSFPANGTKAFVKFGMLSHKTNPLIFLDYVIHEFKEIIQVEQSARFYNNGTTDFVFNYNHSQHQDLCARLAEVLNQFIK